MAKLSKMLLEHPSKELLQLSRPETPQIIEAAQTGNFSIPATIDGLSLAELADNVSPEYLRACLETAKRAMTGQVSPFEGDFPHRMALLLAHKLTPSRKFTDKPPAETPEQVKKTARALKALIKSLAEDGEIVVDSTPAGMGKP